jgi:enamine deaminase RidA (YjgF/YER057c/UK114 family)
MDRVNITTEAPWEKKVGYSRAVRIGNTIEVSGTVALRDSKLVGPGDPYEQTKQILRTISDVLDEAGASITDVIRTRIYVIDISQWDEVGRAHGEVFGDIMPATSMVEISQLIDPGFLVEIEATAILGNPNS